MGWKNWGDHPLVVLIGTIAALVGVFGFPTLYEFLQKPNVAPSPIPSVSSTPTPLDERITLRLRVTDDDDSPLSRVTVTVSSSSPSDSDNTDSNGYVEFQVPAQSSQISLSLEKDGYVTETRNNIDLAAYADRTKGIRLKKK
jgi:hypothetical protein